MERAIIYGIGKYWNENRGCLPQNIEVIAYADSDECKATSRTGLLLEGKEIITPSEIAEREYDLLFLCTDFYFAHRIFQNLKNYNIDLGKVRFLSRMGTGREWNYKAQADKSLISTIDGIAIRERYLTDSDILAEIFITNNYNIHLPETDSVFIDVGMNVGIASLYFARYEWVSKVYGFEPFPDTYKQAVDNFALNDVSIKDKIYPKNIALSDKDEDVEVSIGHEESGWRNIMCRAEGKRCVTITSKKASVEIGEIVSQNADKQIILKIDTEGSEFSIFESLQETNILSNISAVMLEYHRNPEPISKILSAYGFKYFVVGKNSFGMIYAVK